MGKCTKKKAKGVAVNATLQELQASRVGGQVALKGYSYQFLYSCYLILSSSSQDVSFQLEGIEDVDCIKKQSGSHEVTHIQLKYSVNKQDASFLYDVLKNFLEAYLLDQNRFFKLVYDFPVAEGNLSKLFTSHLDKNARSYWENVILNIKQKTPSWNWSVYNFDQFILHLSFERIEKATLADEIEKALIGIYEISTNNISLFANSIKILCFEKMEQRACVTKAEIDLQIQSVKIDISKGPQNPANSWIRKLDYSKHTLDEARGFYEGKKATPAIIANGLPIKRPALEAAVCKSIAENTVTVIKASSGQGKTTLALQAAYLLQDKYTPYQLLCCDDIKEAGNIIQYFHARIRLGEEVLILIDNLDNHFNKWNNLVQLLQSEVHCHYKLLITTRENDWYNYSGDLSNIHSIKVVKPTLDEKEAMEIFKLFREAKQLHPNITSWEKAWHKIAERQLLIEYVYLLTHGEMLSERISSQISEIGRSPSGGAKCEILRKVCFADVCGIKLSIAKLYANQSEKTGSDFGELLKSMESEFLVHRSSESGYIEGLHPIRSKHNVDKLHEFISLDNTAISVIKIAEKTDLPVLFSHLPEFHFSNDKFFNDVVEILWSKSDLSPYISAMQGLFSGSVMQYYLSNQPAFDDADAHGGLLIMSADLCPFARLEEFDVSIDTLGSMRKIMPDDENIAYLCKLKTSIPSYDLQRTSIYAFCNYLYKKLCSIDFPEINDISSYASITEWIYNIDSAFNLSVNISLEYIWSKSEKLTLECISTLMYVSFRGNKETYMNFYNENQARILTYLKHQTKSHRIFIDSEKNAIHVEYILRLSDIKNSNEQSVSRLNYVCRTLPIFALYCADALKPTLDLLAAYTIPDDAHKEMPIGNVAMTFCQNLTSLWNKTILSNYEFDTVAEWLNHYFALREHLCLFANKCCNCICKLLAKKASSNLFEELDQLKAKLALLTIGEKRYPKEEPPFEEKAAVPERFAKECRKYFQSMQNFFNQFRFLLTKEEDKQKLLLFNLTAAQSALESMQHFFAEMAAEFGFQERHVMLCNTETQSINQLTMCCKYYQAHSPEPYFDKYQIKKWYNSYCEAERKKAEYELSIFASEYSVHFPNQIYTINALSYYPIIVDNFNVTQESDFSSLLLDCISFADAPFDYLVVLFMAETKKVYPMALQCPRRTFSNIKTAIKSENYSKLATAMQAFPVEVTLQMLSCFIQKYDLPEKSFPDANDLPVGDLAEELWVYSKSLELLSAPEDALYLAAETQEIQNKITEMLHFLKNELPPQTFEYVNNVCKAVFSGEKFDDNALNKFIEYFVA